MTDLAIAERTSMDQPVQKPAYEPPTLKILNQDEVLQALQMTADEISAAGCWWGAC